jgi:hypothetical protein
MKDHPSQGIHSGLTCRDVAELGSHYLDDRLPVFTKIWVDLHLVSCAHCRSYVMQIGLVSSVLRGLPTLDPHPINRLPLRRQFFAHHGQSVSGN